MKISRLLLAAAMWMGCAIDSGEPQVAATEEELMNNNCACDGSNYCCWNGRLDDQSSVTCTYSSTCYYDCLASSRWSTDCWPAP